MESTRRFEEGRRALQTVRLLRMAQKADTKTHDPSGSLCCRRDYGIFEYITPTLHRAYTITIH